MRQVLACTAPWDGLPEFSAGIFPDPPAPRISRWSRFWRALGALVLRYTGEPR